MSHHPTAPYRILHPTTGEELGIVWATSLDDAKAQLSHPSNLFASHQHLRIVAPPQQEPAPMTKPQHTAPSSSTSSDELTAAAIVSSTQWLLQGLSILTDITVLGTYAVMVVLLGAPAWAFIALALVLAKLGIYTIYRSAARKLTAIHNAQLEAINEQLQDPFSDAKRQRMAEAQNDKPSVH